MNDNSDQQSVQAVVLEFLETAALVERRLDHALSIIRGISFSEYRLLQSLSRMHARSAPRVDLANAVGLTPSAVTRALKPLEKLGYVQTEKSDRDARRSLAALTQAGVELLDDAQRVVDDVLNEFRLVSVAPRKITEFRNRLGELRDK